MSGQDPLMGGQDPQARAWAAAAAVVDPEIPVLTIADLGVLRAVEAEGTAARAVITPTYSGCPAMGVIALEVELALRRAGFTQVTVTTRLSPAWTSDWLGEAARRKLQAYGIAPPAATGAAGALVGVAPPACPRCGSIRTELLAAFGATACKALHRCRDCQEPFEAFKCH